MVTPPSPDENLDMAQLLGEEEGLYHMLHRGEVVDGVIMKVDRDGLLVNVGQKTEGVVPSREMRSLEPEAIDSLKVGDPIVVSVVRPETDEGQALLSLDRAQGERAWRKLQQYADEGAAIEAPVVDYNKGGAIVSVEGVQGFVPLSQLTTVTRAPADSEENPSLAALVGSTLSLKVIEVNRRRNRAILSEKAAVQELRQERKERLLEELTEGETRTGRVSGSTNFGVFVDLGGADGLVHISELSWEPVASPDEVVRVGEVVDVYVIKVDRAAKRIALSLKRTKPEPWASLGDQFKVGAVVPATITRLTAFGAFARVEGAIEGLIHISELTDRVVSHPKEVVREGDKVNVKILKVEPERRRMGLSLKQVEEGEEAATAISYGQTEGEHRIEQPALNAEVAAELNRAVAEAADRASNATEEEPVTSSETADVVEEELTAEEEPVTSSETADVVEEELAAEAEPVTSSETADVAEEEPVASSETADVAEEELATEEEPVTSSETADVAEDELTGVERSTD